jgi:hypothetical protein
MDKKFLNKVVDQIVRETEIDYDKEEIQFPFFSDSSSFRFYSSYILVSIYVPSSLTKHCKDVYGLNEQEIDYVWEEYKHIIKDKIDNGL